MGMTGSRCAFCRLIPALALVVVIVLVSACAHEPPAEGWEPVKDAKTGAIRVPANEADVAFALVQDYFAAEYAKKKPAKGKTQLVVRDESIPVTKKKSISFPQDLKAMQQVLPAVTADLVDAFVKANKSGFLYRAAAGGKEATKVPFTFAPGGKLEKMMRGDEDGFERFFKAYPKAHALVTLSRPGLDAARKYAVLYVTAATGDLAGNGILLLGKKDGASWKVVQKATLWSADQ